jgi:hypothetical protein
VRWNGMATPLPPLHSVANRPPRLDHAHYIGLARYFLTICTRNRRPLFQNPHVAELARDQLLRGHILPWSAGTGVPAPHSCPASTYLPLKELTVRRWTVRASSIGSKGFGTCSWKPELIAAARSAAVA